MLPKWAMVYAEMVAKLKAGVMKNHGCHAQSTHNSCVALA